MFRNSFYYYFQDGIFAPNNYHQKQDKETKLILDLERRIVNIRYPLLEVKKQYLSNKWR